MWLFAVLVYWDFHTEGLFLCPILFLWGRFNVSSSPSTIICYDSLLFVFQFYRAFWLWVLLTGLGDDVCDLLSALLQEGAYHISPICLPALPVFVDG
jgi:hypothetical protein